MKRLVSFGLMLVALSVAFAQDGSKKKQKKSAAGADEQALTKIEEDWGNALVKVDFDTINRIVSPDWILSTPDGKQQTKAQTDADLKSGKIKFESFKINELKVRVYGNAAVVFGLTTEKLTMDGKDMSGQNRFTDTFIKRDGKWQCVATHVTAVPPPEKK
jgi:hypothetical protein